MQENINIPDSNITASLTFRQLVFMNMKALTNFPYIEKDFDALTDYELLCLVVKYLNDVIDNQNEQNDSITSMYEAFLELQTYVNNTKDALETAFNNLDDYVKNYFENLDVQDEINNKLNQMALDGSLTNLIKAYIDPLYQAYENEINADISEYKTNINSQISVINTKVNQATSGSPLAASSTSDMTDTDRIYVNTTDGYWYYYDGSSWTQGGVYQSTANVVDRSLTQSGESADALTTGDYLRFLDNTLLEKVFTQYTLNAFSANPDKAIFHVTDSYYINESGVISSNSAYSIGYLYCERDCKIYASQVSSNYFWLSIVDGADKTEIFDFDNNKITGTQTYRYAKASIPTTEETALDVKVGQTILFIIGNQNAAHNEFKINYFIDNKLNNNIILNTNQVNQLNTLINDKVNFIYNYSTDVMNIFMPFTNRYLMLTIPHTINNNKYANLRRINDISICDSSKEVIYENITSGADIDGVVKVNDESDFIGGYHGYEQLTAITVLLDGEEFTLTENINETVSQVELVMYSTVYTHESVAAFNRIKKIIITKDKVNITNKWISLISLKVNKIYFGMMETKLNYNNEPFTYYGFTDKRYVKTDLSTTSDQPAYNFFTHTDENNTVEVWGKALYYKIGVNYFNTIPQGEFDTFGQLYQSGPKIYIGNDHAMNISANTILLGETTIEFKVF